MARWRDLMKPDEAYFDGCGFGKYWLISIRRALLVPFNCLRICKFGFGALRGSKGFDTRFIGRFNLQ
jgi:hypothetical protein